MRNKIQLTIGMIMTLIICACTENNVDKKDWPAKLAKLEEGLIVQHSSDIVYATINHKDPEKWGRYQLKFTTTVESISEELEIIEFGGYILENEKWVFRTIYDRPFNRDEFDKWYGAKDGKLRVGWKYADNDNWLAKSNYLNGRTFKNLWYFIAKNSKGEQFVGVKEVIGVMKLKK